MYVNMPYSACVVIVDTLKVLKTINQKDLTNSSNIQGSVFRNIWNHRYTNLNNFELHKMFRLKVLFPNTILSLQWIYIWHYWTYQNANSTFCHFCHQKRQFVLYVIIFSAFSNLKIFSCKTHDSHTVHQNNIKFSVVMTKVTKCWNLHFDTFNNIKYKFSVELHHVYSLMEKLRQISQSILNSLPSYPKLRKKVKY